MVGKSALWGAENEEEKEGVGMVVPPFTLSLIHSEIHTQGLLEDSRGNFYIFNVSVLLLKNSSTLPNIACRTHL